MLCAGGARGALPLTAGSCLCSLYRSRSAFQLFPEVRKQRRRISDPSLLSSLVNVQAMPLLDSLPSTILVNMSNAATAVNDTVRHLSH